mmetsp:Transcript_4069/g.13039  ORF Transcript_4069/g.13039 Transcript_4069/m.13039 type:complete len:90 (+) Transcript_4069:871-1140(+)
MSIYILDRKFRDNTGWTTTEEINLRTLSSGLSSGGELHSLVSSSRFVAAHSSRLVPNIMIVADQERKLLMCYDRTKSEELPADAVASFA